MQLNKRHLIDLFWLVLVILAIKIAQNCLNLILYGLFKIAATRLHFPFTFRDKRIYNWICISGSHYWEHLTWLVLIRFMVHGQLKIENVFQNADTCCVLCRSLCLLSLICSILVLLRQFEFEKIFNSFLLKGNVLE